MFSFGGHPYAWLNVIHCFKIAIPWFCLKYKTSVRKLQYAFPAFFAAIRRSLGNEEIVASLGNRGKCSKGYAGRAQKEILLTVLSTLTVFLYIYLHVNKLRFTQ